MKAAQLLLLCLAGCVAAASAQDHPMIAMMRMMDSLGLPDAPNSFPLVKTTMASSPLSSLGGRLMRISIPMGSDMPLGSILQDAMDCACEEAAQGARSRQSALAATAPLLPMGGASLLPRASGFFGGMPAGPGGRSMSMRMVRDGSGSIRKTTTTVDAEGNEETRTETIPEGGDGDDAGDVVSQMLFGKGSPFADPAEDQAAGIDQGEGVVPAEDEDEEELAMDDEQDEDKASENQEENQEEEAGPAQDGNEEEEENAEPAHGEEESPVEVSGKGLDSLDAASKNAILSAVSSKLNLNPKELQMVSSALDTPAAAAKDGKADAVSALEDEVVANAKADAAVRAQEAKTLDDIKIAEGKASADADAAKKAASEAENKLVEQQKALERLSKMQSELERVQAHNVVA